MKESWRNIGDNKILRQSRLIQWRREPVVLKVENPTRLDRARSLGYRAKKGFLIARVRLSRGGRKREKIRKGRRSKHFGRRKIVGKSYQWIAEERANKNFINLEVLNSYLLAKDGKNIWFEVILVDPERPEIKADHRINWINNPANRGRVFRGLTSAGRKSRGLLNKGIGAEKIRPSLASNQRRAK